MILRFLALTALIGILLTACNDKSTDLGADLVPGTDSLYAISSLDSLIVDSMQTLYEPTPLFNNTYFLLGTTGTSHARIFLELVNYPTIGSADKYEVLQADLLFEQMAYRYGPDTAARSVDLRAYELQKMWDPAVTWDSVYDAGGRSSYYSTAQQPMGSLTRTLTDADTIVPMPIDVAVAKRWLVHGVDSTLRQDIFGMAIEAAGGQHIQQFRNKSGASQVFRFRVITKHVDSAAPDTTTIESVVANLVHAPAPEAGALISQGAVAFRPAIDVNLSRLPANAVILEASLRLTLDPATSTQGTTDGDAVLKTFIVPEGSTVTYEYRSRISTANQYLFSNMAAPLQRLLRTQTHTGRLRIGADGGNEAWQMNRLSFMTSTAERSQRPVLTIIYTRPTVLP